MTRTNIFAKWPVSVSRLSTERGRPLQRRQRSRWLDPLHVRQIPRQDHTGGESNQSIGVLTVGCAKKKSVFGAVNSHSWDLSWTLSLERSLDSLKEVQRYSTRFRMMWSSILGKITEARKILVFVLYASKGKEYSFLFQRYFRHHWQNFLCQESGAFLRQTQAYDRTSGRVRLQLRAHVQPRQGVRLVAQLHPGSFGTPIQ